MEWASFLCENGPFHSGLEEPTTMSPHRMNDDASLLDEIYLYNRPRIKVPTATILGGPELHVDMGSTINLTCTIKYSPEPPAYIFWYHHDEVRNNLSVCASHTLLSLCCLPAYLTA
uniref:Ig-like domain-containing protein n=1 Tax=Timema poppense TaxID=170557 RepID=A0A7R9H090_TIMPO|nr:unnamed protein product [Timema poppensis]